MGEREVGDFSYSKTTYSQVSGIGSQITLNIGMFYSSIEESSWAKFKDVMY